MGLDVRTGQREKPTGTARIAKKNETQELRLSVRGVTGARWAAFCVTEGLDVTAHSKNEARPAMVKVTQGKA
jgi:hypothetical protein